MKILLFGKCGQVGWELQRALACVGEVVALDSESTDLHADFSRPDGLANTVQLVRPDVIVNAAAYTAVDKAETEQVLARTVNALAPGVLANVAARLGSTLVHYSTDYVFDGSGNTARQEDAPTGPLSVYGRTKLEGEDLIRTSGCSHIILRTSWVYAARGTNFLRTMLRLAAEKDRLAVIDDQIGAPTGAALLADVTAHVVRLMEARPALSGTYHAVAAGETSWHRYACHVIEYARSRGYPIRVAKENIEPIPAIARPTPARRPQNSRLATGKLRSTFGLTLPRWEASVERTLAEILDHWHQGMQGAESR
jgi:dTDP-4-dehydrorhamnose reductase